MRRLFVVTIACALGASLAVAGDSEVVLSDHSEGMQAIAILPTGLFNVVSAESSEDESTCSPKGGCPQQDATCQTGSCPVSQTTATACESSCNSADATSLAGKANQAQAEFALVSDAPPVPTWNVPTPHGDPAAMVIELFEKLKKSEAQLATARAQLAKAQQVHHFHYTAKSPPASPELVNLQFEVYELTSQAAPEVTLRRVTTQTSAKESVCEASNESCCAKEESLTKLTALAATNEPAATCTKSCPSTSCNEDGCDTAACTEAKCDTEVSLVDVDEVSTTENVTVKCKSDSSPVVAVTTPSGCTLTAKSISLAADTCSQCTKTTTAATFVSTGPQDNWSQSLAKRVAAGQAKVVSRPQIMTVSGRMAQLSMGGKVALPGRENEFVEIGTRIETKPQVLASGKIQLELLAEWTNLKTYPEHDLPLLASRRVQTTVKLEPGKPSVLAGIEHLTGDDVAGTQIGGVVIVVTPKIVESTDRVATGSAAATK